MRKAWPALAIVIGVLHVPAADCVPIKNAKTEDIATVLKYFIKFGHTDSNVLRSTNKNDAITALEEDMKKFQKFAGLNQTGELDDATKLKLKEPRCGTKDNVGRRSISKTGRRKRYYLHGSRWRVKTLTYRIDNAPASVPGQKYTDNVLEDALNTWAREANINFEPARDDEKAHIGIKFATGSHGDADPFDGPGGTLAHAYFPIYGGDAHFDDAESWSINSRAGSNLYVASTHEFGHSLGLSHSDVRSMMSPWYQRPSDPFSRNLLADDDRRAIRQLYGRRDRDDPGPKPADPGPEMRPRGGGGRRRGRFPNFFSIFGGGRRGGRRGFGRPQPRRPRYPRRRSFFPFGFMKQESKTKQDGDPELCTDGKIDAALSVGNETFVFRGKKYWRLTGQGVAVGYPRNITESWRGGVAGPLVAAVHHSSKLIIYMFSGTQVWALSSATYDPLEGYPRAISDEFPGATGGGPLTAAFVWNTSLYLVQSDKYWIVGGAGGAQSLADIFGMPATINAATLYGNGVTYVFQGQRYYRLDTKTFKVDDSDEVPYPRSTSIFWFGCPSGV